METGLQILVDTETFAHGEQWALGCLACVALLERKKHLECTHTKAMLWWWWWHLVVVVVVGRHL